MTGFIEIHITTSSEQEAEILGGILVEKGLAACAQISGPIQSIYRWEGKTERSREWFCCVKSRKELFPALVQVVRENHSYDCPQITAFPILDANEDYLHWMQENLSGG